MIDTSPPFENRTLDATLKRVCEEYKPKSYLEIGTREGNSLMTVVNNAPYLERIAVVDSWGIRHGGTGRKGPEHVIELATEEGFIDILTIYSGLSRKMLPQVKGTFDLVLVDADHTWAGCWDDMKLSLPLMEPGGIMVVDDCKYDDFRLTKCVIRFHGEYVSEIGLIEINHQAILEKKTDE